MKFVAQQKKQQFPLTARQVQPAVPQSTRPSHIYVHAYKIESIIYSLQNEEKKRKNEEKSQWAFFVCQGTGELN
jgi:hypothetical protein